MRSADTIVTRYTCNVRYCINTISFYFLIFHQIDLQLNGMNAIVVEWNDLSKWEYSVASSEISFYVAKAIRATMIRLTGLMNMSSEEKRKFYESMIMMGHSMGCHIIGLVGELLKTNNGHKVVGTIVAIEAAGPSYSPLKKKPHCLTHNDAMRVLTLHTGDNYWGNSFLLGHENYFANGGRSVLPAAECASHFRGVNLIRSLIRKTATGYKCKNQQGNLLRGKKATSELMIAFDFNKIPNYENTPIVRYPIYLPVLKKSPYFNDYKVPVKCPPYNKKTTNKANFAWDSIAFDNDPQTDAMNVLRTVSKILPKRAS